MSYKYNKVKEIEIEFVKKFFMDFGKFSDVRKDIIACEMCDKDFKDSDNTNLAFVRNDENIIVCDDCTDMILSNGAIETNW